MLNACATLLENLEGHHFGSLKADGKIVLEVCLGK
jgi:hypothetical protein